MSFHNCERREKMQGSIVLAANIEESVKANKAKRITDFAETRGYCFRMPYPRVSA
jgi:hypothetical protein